MGPESKARAAHKHQVYSWFPIDQIVDFAIDKMIDTNGANDFIDLKLLLG